jgi:hypothetical protein
MTDVRGLCLALVVCLCAASSVRADVPALDGSYHPKPWGHGAPPPGWFERNTLQNPPSESQDSQPTQPPKPTPQPPRRTGPFRSCGSGMGVGLAGIGIAWGMMWVGTRYAARMTRTRQTDQREGGNA